MPVARVDAAAGRGVSGTARWWRWAALAAVLASGGCVASLGTPGSRPSGCARGCAVPAPPGGSLRVMTLNVLHGFPGFTRLRLRLDLVAGEIRRQRADIVSLQEVPWTPFTGDGAAYLARRTGMNHVYVRANGNRWSILFEEGVALLSRYPLHGVRSVHLTPDAGYFEHRVALAAVARTPWGELPVVATHLSPRPRRVNAAQLRSLAGVLAALPAGSALLAGDLNTRAGAAGLRAVARGWVDAWRAARPLDPGPTCCIRDLSRAAAALRVGRLDYVFLLPRGDDAWRVRAARRVAAAPFAVPGGWQWASDHAGVLVELAPRRAGAQRGAAGAVSDPAMNTVPVNSAATRSSPRRTSTR